MVEHYWAGQDLVDADDSQADEDDLDDGADSVVDDDVYAGSVPPSAPAAPHTRDGAPASSSPASELSFEQKVSNPKAESMPPPKFVTKNSLKRSHSSIGLDADGDTKNNVAQRVSQQVQDRINHLQRLQGISS